jgi:small subunit ribosomal protein S18
VTDSQETTNSPAPAEGGERPNRFAPRGPRPEGGAGDGERPRGGRRFGGGRFGSRRKVCAFCMDGIKEVDYKDLPHLRRHISERGKIEPRRKTGTCAKHQRSLTVAIKRARHVALLPFVGGTGRF